MVTISTVYKSQNFDQRPFNKVPDYIILHSTEVNFDYSLYLLTKPTERPVSAHYLINVDGTIFQLVDNLDRAWHAGQSYWRGQEKLNDSSIGIEIVNVDQQPYPMIQINASIELCKQLQVRHTIPPYNILAHSDIAPYRKSDPGAHFPWQQLVQHHLLPTLNRSQPLNDTKENSLRKLEKIGYDIRPVAQNPEAPEALNTLVMAFQRRFSPRSVHGLMDIATQIQIDQVFRTWPVLPHPF